MHSGQRIGKNAVENNYFRGEAMDDHMSSAWLSGKISDEEYKAYQDARFKNGAMAGKVLVNGVALATGGAAVVQAGKTLVQKGIKAGVKKFGKDAVKNAAVKSAAKNAAVTNTGINATSGALGAGWTSAMEGGDWKTVGTSALVGGGAGAFFGGKLFKKPVSYLGATLKSAATGGIGGGSGGFMTTIIMSPNADRFEYANSIMEGITYGTIGGSVMGPISYAGRAAPVAANFAATMYALQIDALTGILDAKTNFIKSGQDRKH